MTDDFDRSVPKFIRRVMPQATEPELREATATFDEYMAVVWEIFQRVNRERQAVDSPKSGVCDRFDNNEPSV
jgi:hypothetical protein